MFKSMPKINFPAKILISISILTLLFFQMDFETLKTIEFLHPSAWIYATGFILLQLFLLAFRWLLLINIGHYRINYFEAVQITLASFVANILLITTISGIAVRIAMACSYGASLFKSIFATAIDRLLTLAALFILSAIFLPALGKYIDAPIFENITLYIAALVFIVFVIAPFMGMHIANNLQKLPLEK